MLNGYITGITGVVSLIATLNSYVFLVFPYFLLPSNHHTESKGTVGCLEQWTAYPSIRTWTFKEKKWSCIKYCLVVYCTVVKQVTNFVLVWYKDPQYCILCLNGYLRDHNILTIGCKGYFQSWQNRGAIFWSSHDYRVLVFLWDKIIS